MHDSVHERNQTLPVGWNLMNLAICLALDRRWMEADLNEKKKLWLLFSGDRCPALTKEVIDLWRRK